MPIDYSRLQLPKVNATEATYREEMEKLIARLDRLGSEQARARAAGRCEVWIDGERCTKPDTQTHHMLGTRNIRGRGESAKAHRKQRVCHGCHRRLTGAIGAGKLTRIGGEMPHWTDRYRSTK